MKLFKRLSGKGKKNHDNNAQGKNDIEANDPIAGKPLRGIVSSIREAFGESADFRSIEAKIAGKYACLFYLDSLIEQKTFKKTTAKLLAVKESGTELEESDDLIGLCNGTFGGGRHAVLESEGEILSAMLNGSLVIAVDGLEIAVAVFMPSQEKRQVEEPAAQTIIRGPREGFVETLSVNVNLIRKRIRNANLRFEEFIIGEETRTKVYIGYMSGIANESIVDEVRKRLRKIKIASIFESGNIEEMITDKTASPFPLALNSERADTAAANLMEGKVVVLVDGTPFCLIVPAVMVNFFEMSEDYYQPFMLGSFIRIIRYISFMLALLTPSLYVAILSFHPELLPTTLLISVLSQREGVPFPAVVEVLIMEITFEILREAGIRTPKTIGMMVSIVGALVIGQAAAEAGIISNTMIIVVAITAIANFASPIYSFSAASRIMRFALIIAASIMGLYGVLLVLILLVAHLCSLRSFGVPYLAPVAPFILEDQKDVFVRFPWGAMRRRPKYLFTEQSEKNFGGDKPGTPPKMEARKQK